MDALSELTVDRYPDRHLGATILWTGTNALYTRSGDPGRARRLVQAITTVT